MHMLVEVCFPHAWSESGELGVGGMQTSLEEQAWSWAGVGLLCSSALHAGVSIRQ